MNQFEPNEPNVGNLEFIEEELSVEQVALMEMNNTEVEITTGISDESNDSVAGNENELSQAAPQPIIPVPILPLNRRVSGRYENCPKPWKLELRIDVDGYRPMRRVSGDYFVVSGNTVSYFGSFVVNAISLSITSSQVTITGIADTTWNTSYKKVRIVIPRHNIFQPPANATIQWMTLGNVNGASYTCVYQSPYFRSVDLEQDFEQGVIKFNSYNTGSLPSGGPARSLTVTKAYNEAGIEMRDIGSSNQVATAPGGTWSNAELHNAMQSHFSLWKDDPQWKVWLFHAMKHDYGLGLRGIMFDQKNKQRQGCASFYQVMGGNTAAKLREQLYVGVHELGHCFNLYHSFHKKYMNPPKENRFRANSWMNYPRNFPEGANAFWSAFSFQFDNLEVIHLRHAFRNNIIIGGNPFGTGAALEGVDGLADNIVDNSGLKLELRTSDSFALGEPVVTEIKLSTTDLNGKLVHKQLHPNFSFVQIAIEYPNGGVIVYEPPIEHFAEIETVRLDEENPSIYDSAYIGYDADNELIFDAPGMYKLRGIYYAFDGSVVLSDVISLRVKSPLKEADDKVADLLLNDEVGMLFYLLGSDSEYLEGGNEALDTIIKEYSKHPLAVYAQLVKGYNLAREFKTIQPDNEVETRKPKLGEAEKLLNQVVDSSKEDDTGVDNITLNMTMQQLAKAQGNAGKTKEAKATMKEMVNIFEKKDLRPHVMKTIKEQAAEVTSEL